MLLDNGDGMSEDRLCGYGVYEMVCVSASVTLRNALVATTYRGRDDFLAAQRQTCVMFHRPLHY